MIHQRPIDDAMAANRPEKNFVRHLWLDEIQRAEQEGYDSHYPLYLTLPGRLGGEINLLIEHGIVRRTETGAIHSEDSHKIVALESSKAAQIELLRRYPGMNVLQMPIQSLIKGDGQRNFPENKDEIIYCKAKIINLDLNEPIKVGETVNEIAIPVIEWIKKFSLLHREDRIDWSLCLTLHGEIFWNNIVNAQVIKLLIDNCNYDATFKELLIIHLGEKIAVSLFSGQIDFTNITQREMQKVLMVLIPKLLVQYASNNGWIISTVHNYSYTGGGGAPMVTWVFNFHINPDAAAQVLTEYHNGIRNIFQQVGFINEDGEVNPIR
ncbi:hypothetical protein LARV_00523 [Longilinea arvoryzae]|uniref:Uncharacterized protein n=1 Tax=Longilinea arvoryzae TaxID=360412 RepID=A0A0S7BE81_9CHLR|nr:hypothetical protein [Longilinea arvoryzae]GAP12787.1 hypothetical protein LARV_00523 [Longilinea arvoryzae]